MDENQGNCMPKGRNGALTSTAHIEANPLPAITDDRDSDHYNLSNRLDQMEYIVKKPRYENQNCIQFGIVAPPNELAAIEEREETAYRLVANDIPELKRPKSASSIRPRSTLMVAEKTKTPCQGPDPTEQDHGFQDIEGPRARKSRRRGRRGIRKLNIPEINKPEDMWRFVEDKCTALEEQTHALVQSESFATFESQRRRGEVLLKRRQQINSLITQYGSTYDMDQSKLWDIRMAHTGAWLEYCQRVSAETDSTYEK